jgi:hypothetical protein
VNSRIQKFLTLGGRVVAVLFLLSGPAVQGWDYDLHRLIHRAALASLPPEFPDFVRTPRAAGRIAFLAGEADRWRNSPDFPLRHQNGPDHYFDVDDLPAYGIDFKTVSPFRYEFAADVSRVRAEHPERFPAIDPENNLDRTKAWPGFLPWTITEHFGRLKSAFSYLKTFEEGGTPEEIENARENVILVMGIMGHFVADAAQPLHTTHHYNGWTGANPKGYSTNRTLHAWIDGGYLAKTGMDAGSLVKSARPARSLLRKSRPPGDTFGVVMDYIGVQFARVEPLYEMEKRGEFSGKDAAGLKGRAFIEQQLLEAAGMLGDLWYSAWKEAGPDNYLRSQLARRKASQPTADH